MNALATLPLGMTVLCLAAALIGAVGAWRHARRGRVALALLQLPLAVLLLLALATASPRDEARLLVLSAGAQVAVAQQPSEVQRVVALPGASAPPNIEVVPDLATALRRYRGVYQVRVVGRGLSEHDRAALGSRSLVFEPTATPSPATAFVELDAPKDVLPGTLWTVRGHVTGAVERVELLDPAGAEIAATAPDREGGFALQGASRAAGPALFTLRAMRGDAVAATLPLPIAAGSAVAPRVLLYAALPTPDAKYLRRWALDAGVQLESRIGLAPTLVQRRGTARLDAATLADADLLIVDERSWPQLSAQSPLLREAIADGLGLLVRVTGPVPERVAREWRELGIDVAFDAQVPREVRLTAADAPLHAWPVAWRGDAASAPAAWRDATGAALAAVLPRGQGRIGAVWLTDSFRLRTRGASERHATLWSSLVGALARPRAQPRPSVPDLIVPGRRALLCGLPPAARLLDPDGAETTLVVQDGCAAWWPRESGWHRLSIPSAPILADVYVHAPADVAALIDQIDRDATAALANGPGDEAAAVRSALPLDGRWLAAWFILLTSTWWLERRARNAVRPTRQRERSDPLE